MTSLAITEEPDPPLRRSGHRSRSRFIRKPQAWLVAFLGFFLMGAAWTFAAPYDGPPDELQHAVRAYGVVSGQLSDRLIDAPKSLQPANVACARWHHDVSYKCASVPGMSPGDYQVVPHDVSTYSYPPFYYYVVGLPLKLMPDMRGIIVARLVTDALMAGVLAGCVAVVGRLRSARWLLPALIVVATPVVINLAGAINPAGPELAFGIALAIAVIALVELREISRGVAVLTAVSGFGLAVTRPFGLGWLAATVFIVGVLGLSKQHAKDLWRSRDLRIAGGVVGVGVLASLWWKFSHATPIIGAGTQTIKLSDNQIVAMELWDRTSFYTNGLVSQTSYGDIPMPPWINFIWFGAAGFLIIGGLVAAGLRDRLRIILIIGVSYLALIYADYSALKNGFWESQGRYALPFLAGAPLLGACILSRNPGLDAYWPRLGRIFAFLLLPIQLIALAATMIRWQRGQNDQFPIHLNPFRGTWLPIWGPVAPMVFCVLGVLLIGFTAYMTPSLSRLRPGPAERELDSRRGPDSSAGSEVDGALTEAL